MKLQHKFRKKKGSDFERLVAKMMSEAFGLPFTRVPSSGARIGKSNAKRKANMDERQIGTARGDLIPPEALKFIVVECKHQLGFTRMPLNIQTKGWRELNEALDQLTADCDGDFTNNMPFLFIKGTATEPMMVALQPHVNLHRHTILRIEYWYKSNLWLIMDAKQAMKQIKQSTQN